MGPYGHGPRSNLNEPPYTWPDTWPQQPRRRRGGGVWLVLIVLTALAVAAWRSGLIGG